MPDEIKPKETADSGSTQETPKITEPDNPDSQGEDSQWQFNTEDDAQAPRTSNQEVGKKELSWTASEFVAHEKSIGWYALLAVASVVMAGIIYALTRDEIATGMVVFVAIMFGIVAGRKPRVLDYRIGPEGVTVGGKIFLYSVLKSFAVVQDGAVRSITLLPMRRFMPSVTLYFPPDQEDEVLEVLGNYLPLEERSSDPIDHFMRKIRF